MDMDYRTVYHLECYLECTVKARFHQNKELDAFDFFCIVIWKANRAKSKVTKRILITLDSKWHLVYSSFGVQADEVLRRIQRHSYSSRMV